jgi:2-polyprenylphenol 6-hydroxylase
VACPWPDAQVHAIDTDFEVAIVGGGPNGAITAALLARYSGIAAERIALMAPELAPDVDAADGGRGAPGQAPDELPAPMRVAAISRASEMVLHNADAWSRLPEERVCAYQRMRVWHESVPSDGPEVLVFSAAEVGEPNLGYIVENRSMSAAGLASFVAQGGQVLGVRIGALQVEEGAVRLHTGEAELTARLVIGADGAHSQVREFMKIPLRTHDYRQGAVVANIGGTRPHQHTAWQRFLGSGPLALLPLFNGCSSIVWSADQPLAEELTALPADEFARRLDAASDGVLGATRLLSQRVLVPLRRATAVTMIGARAALVGDAAHVVHPLAGQGVNLGFLDAAVLCAVLAAGMAEREDPGAARLLTRYEQLRLTHDTLMSWSMSAFNELFSRASGPGGWLAARLLGLAGATGIARRTFARRALGLSGEVPPLARGVQVAPRATAAKC